MKFKGLNIIIGITLFMLFASRLMAADTFTGAFHQLQLSQNGDVLGKGSNVQGALGLGPSLGAVEWKVVFSNAKAVAVGPFQSYILDKDGTLWGCGQNWFGQINPEDGNWVYEWTAIKHNVQQFDVNEAALTVVMVNGLRQTRLFSSPQWESVSDVAIEMSNIR